MAIPVLGKLASFAQQIGLVEEKKSKTILKSIEDVRERDLGVDPDSITTDKVTEVTYMFDDSRSMESVIDRVMSSYHRGIQIIKKAPTKNEVLIGVLAISGRILSPYQKRRDYIPLKSFSTDLDETPLFYATIKLCGHVMAKQSQLFQAGIQTRTMTMILTDGRAGDHALASEASDCVQNLLAQYRSKVYGVGFGPYALDSLRQLGIPEETLFDAGNEQILEQAFQEFSQASSAAS